jgi:hypothetical protein
MAFFIIQAHMPAAVLLFVRGAYGHQNPTVVLVRFDPPEHAKGINAYPVRRQVRDPFEPTLLMWCDWCLFVYDADGDDRAEVGRVFPHCRHDDHDDVTSQSFWPNRGKGVGVVT